jgi:hypothetical protein
MNQGDEPPFNEMPQPEDFTAGELANGMGVIYLLVNTQQQ